MKISMYLGSSKYWWAWLGIRSNPRLLQQMTSRSGRAIFFEDLSQLPSHAVSASTSTLYVHIFWDGLPDPAAVRKTRAALGPAARLTTLVVGHFAPVEGEDVTSLYAEGRLRFSRTPLSFDSRTTLRLTAARLKTLLMPLKNILQNPRTVKQSIDLLLGKRRFVFCGSYGTVPAVVHSFCERHSVSPQLFESYAFYSDDPSPSFATYRQYLRANGFFLADLYDRSHIDAAFFLSMTHLLGREYFIEKLRDAGLPLFANGYATGVNVNVYTTPFYAQHVFLDFGSAVGTGNYPRLADLEFFRKTFVEIGLNGELEPLLAHARAATLEAFFDQEWERKSPQLKALIDPPHRPT